MKQQSNSIYEAYQKYLDTEMVQIPSNKKDVVTKIVTMREFMRLFEQIISKLKRNTNET